MEPAEVHPDHWPWPDPPVVAGKLSATTHQAMRQCLLQRRARLVNQHGGMPTHGAALQEFNAIQCRLVRINDALDTQLHY